MRVEIDESIRNRPELLSSVEAANRYLEELAGASGPHVQVEWRLSPNDDRLVELGLSEDRDFHAGVRPTFPTSNLLDPVSRKVRLNRAWDFILAERSRHSMERIHDLINQLERRELDGREVAD
jgi:hypothetical protein